MGLSGPKNKTRIGRDPNNTSWSRNTDRFGHKLLTAQGWTPGQSLGAVDAAHARHYTQASSSHIRVLLKDDNLGLGAKRVGVGETASNFGLNVFNGLLGRLNGKSEAEVEKVEAETNAKVLKMYHARRWGHIHFVPGGQLERDDLDRLADDSLDAEVSAASDDQGVAGIKHRKRKRSSEDKAETAPESSSSPKRARTPVDLEKPKRRQKDRRGGEEAEAGDASGKLTGKSKKKKKDHGDKESKPDSQSEEKADKRAEKARRKTEKAEKKRLKEEKKQRKQEKRSKVKRTARRSAEDTSAPTTASSSGTSTPQTSRNLSRQRYIQQKRMASRNAQALNEILMIKSSA